MQSSNPTTHNFAISRLSPEIARDIMRKDKGVNGDVDRLPILTWIMFLKFLDDLEFQHDDEAKLRCCRATVALLGCLHV